MQTRYNENKKGDGYNRPAPLIKAMPIQMLTQNKEERMKRVLKKGMVMLLAAIMVTLSAMPVSAAKIRGRNTQAVKRGCQIVNAQGTFEAPNTTALLKRINAIRLEACTAGNVPNPNNPSRMLTRSDYTPVKWSTELEKMAQLRAAEASFWFAHSRPNGDADCWSAAYGVQAYGENLASAAMAKSIENWYSEKANWIKIKQFQMNTGHYYNLIDPSVRYVALGSFTNASGSRATSLEKGGGSGLSEKKTGEYGAYTQQIEMTKANAARFFPSSPATVKASKVTLSRPSCSLTVGKSVPLTASGSPSNTTDKSVTWTSSNSAVASVSKGTVKAKKAGTATITVKTSNGKSATCKVTVKAQAEPSKPVSTFRLSKSKLSLTPGQNARINFTGASGRVTARSSNLRTASAWNDGSITAFRPGKATITYTDATGASAVCEVTVAYKAGETVRVHIPKSVIPLKVGQKAAWEASVSPATTTDQIMNYTYSSNRIITYNGGYIHALKAGTEKITVHTFGGQTAVCTVIVTK